MPSAWPEPRASTCELRGLENNRVFGTDHAELIGGQQQGVTGGVSHVIAFVGIEYGGGGRAVAGKFEFATFDSIGKILVGRCQWRDRFHRVVALQTVAGDGYRRRHPLLIVRYDR